MIFTETKLKGAFIIAPDLMKDDRGFFARTFCQHEFIEKGLNPNLVQCNISFNSTKGTLRGMHFQIAPHSEVKLVRCTAGAICDVIIDLRPKSETYKQYFTVTLSNQNRQMLYIPEGFAHGYQTLEDNSEVFYQVSAFYNPGSERGLRWNDPAFGIKWPLPVSLISKKDSLHPYWKSK